MAELTKWIHGLSWGDWLSLAIFALCWMGYTHWFERGEKGRRGLIGISHEYRLQWAIESAFRDSPITCASLVANLMRSVSFYASTTIYIVAGLFALIGTVDKIELFTADLPFARNDQPSIIQLKVLLLIIVFVNAYFKFTWSLRQFNFLCMLIGGQSSEKNMPSVEYWERSARRMSRINSFAGDEFNRGIRAYYYGLAAMAWFINPWLFIASTVWVTWVLYRRDFHSPTIKVLRDEIPPEVRDLSHRGHNFKDNS